MRAPTLLSTLARQCNLRSCLLTGRTPSTSEHQLRFYAAQAAPQSTPALNESAKAVQDIRNIGISAHIDSGKTTVTERILYYAGRIDSMHEVRGKDQVGATMDFMDLERQRGITIQSAATYIDWHGTNINIIDTPGHVDFTVEVERALRVLDGAVLVMCSVAGVQSQTMTVNRQMGRYEVPCIAFVNKLDRKGGDAYKCTRGLKEKLNHNAALIQLPIGTDADFCGIVDLVTMRAVYFEEPNGETLRDADIPEDMVDLVNEKRAELIEKCANGDEILCEMYMEEKTPTEEQLRDAIRRATLARQFVPVLCGSALKNKGVQPLMDAIVEYLPNPAQVRNVANVEEGEKNTEVVLSPARSDKDTFVGMAFKLERSKYGQLTYMRVYQGRVGRGDTLYNTRDGSKVRVPRLIRMHAQDMQDIDSAYAGDICAVYGIDCASGDTFTSKPAYPISLEGMHVAEPVISMSITPVNRKDSDNFLKALHRFTKEDPTFRRSYDPESRETIVSGMGELHLDIYASRMASEFDCPVTLGQPNVAFRETLSAPVKYNHLHRQQTGGQGQFGRIQGIAEPMPHDMNTKVEFIDETMGSNIPKPLIAPLRKGFSLNLEKGPVAGQQITGIRWRLMDGATHEVDSTEIAMLNTIKGAMEDVFHDGQWHVIEPIMKVEATVPEEFQAVVSTQLHKRQGHVTDMTGSGDGFISITAEVPLNKMFGYSMELRSATEGKGEYSMEYARYAPVDAEIQQQLVQKHHAALEEEEKQQQQKKGKKRK